MAEKQRTVGQISQSVKRLLCITLCVLLFSPVYQVYAKSLSYGPIKSGDTLWKIAKENLPNPSLSIEQFVYSIYASNPKAFQSGNINRLQRGITLQLPDIDFISKISKPEAKKQIAILQTDARELTRAKVNSKKFKQQVNKYQRQLRKYRRNTRRWKNVYRKLARSKKNLAISNRKITRLTKSIRDKRQLQLAELSKASNKEDTNKKVIDSSADSVEQTDSSQQKVDDTAKKLSKVEPKKEKVLQAAPLKQVKPESAVKNKLVKQDVVGTSEKIKANKIEGITPASQKNQTETQEVRKAQGSSSSDLSSNTKKINWFNYISENFILIAGIINGLILIFVLFKLFEKKEDPDFSLE